MDLRWHFKIGLTRLAIWALNSTGWYDGYFNHWRTMFDYAEQRGLHIMPVHYYSPIPDTQNLPGELWIERRLLQGVELNTERAREWLDDFMPKYRTECENLRRDRTHNKHEYFLENDAYGRGDADVLYSILRETKPRKIIEIGSGYSTLLISQAIRSNRLELANYQCEFLAIEPNPPPYLVPPPIEVTRIEHRPVQQMALEEFRLLRENDVLFIDSSHTVKIGSDVLYEILSILPSLCSGVMVHLHDIFTPFEYPKRWTKNERFFWNEQYMLEAFLAFNDEFEVILPLHAISQSYPKALNELVSLYETDRHSVSSFWLRRR